MIGEEDATLLISAARAVGRDFELGFTEMFWNPLVCDKDAFRLMCDLNIMVRFQNKDSIVVEWDVWVDGGDGFLYSDTTDEINIGDIPCGEKSNKMRRAIVRAAAAIGEQS